MSISRKESPDPVVSKRPARAFALAGPLVLLVGACSSGNANKPPALSPQTVSPVAPEAPESPPEPPPQTANDEATRASGPEPSTAPKTIVIDPGGEAEDRQTLLAAATAERERRAASGGPTVVITDENLKSRAIGQLTIATPATTTASAGEESDETPPPVDQPEAETYWRQRALSARIQWRDLANEIEELEGEVNLLRRRFYDEDDPYYRDSQIKPAWDRALDRLRETRLLADEAAQLVLEVLEDGRRAGALPGWLREGVEIEPGREGQSPPDRTPLREHQSRDPEIYEPDDDGDGGGDE